MTTHIDGLAVIVLFCLPSLVGLACVAIWEALRER